MARTEPDYSLKLHDQIRSAARSIGVRNRQPQGTIVAFSVSGSGVFDDTDTMDVFLSFPDRVYVLVETKIWLLFREFFTSAKSALASGALTSDSGGGSTSGSGGATSSGLTDGTTVVGSYMHAHTDPQGGNTGTVTVDELDHHHSIASHSHSTPAHVHSTPSHVHQLVYGVWKETMPASHSATLGVSRLDGSSWTPVVSIPGLTDDIHELNLTQYVDRPVLWRLRLKSDAGQPNGGRLGCDVAGAVLGAIKSA
jgi:hypothetical protein